MLHSFLSITEDADSVIQTQVLHFDSDCLAVHELVVSEDHLPDLLGLGRESVLPDHGNEGMEPLVVVEDASKQIGKLFHFIGTGSQSFFNWCLFGGFGKQLYVRIHVCHVRVILHIVVKLRGCRCSVLWSFHRA